MAKSLTLRAKELYWTATRTVGLAKLHEVDFKHLRDRMRLRAEQRLIRRQNTTRFALPDTYKLDRHQLSLFHILWSQYARDHGGPSDPARVLQFKSLLESVHHFKEGDYIELGVQRGFTARIIYQMMPKVDCNLYLLDTYKTSFAKRDLDAEADLYGNSGWAPSMLFPPTSPEGVTNLVTSGIATERVKTIAGWFPESFAGLEQKRWRFVHIDFDLYQPIRTALDMLWPKVVDGGVVLIHDYGCTGFPGAKRACDEFGEQIGLRPVMLADHMGTALFIKPREVAPVPQPIVHATT